MGPRVIEYSIFEMDMVIQYKSHFYTFTTVFYIFGTFEAARHKTTVEILRQFGCLFHLIDPYLY